MGAQETSGDELDAYLSCPDCPVCGSDDVSLTQSCPDGLGNIVHVHLCGKCRHVWSEATPA